VANSVYRELDGSIRFAFTDSHDNYLSVNLTQKQVDEYRNVLDMFSTKPTSPEGKDANRTDEPGRTSTPK
jgi:hypothetical protein